MEEKELKEKWEEIIATANNEDPEYSFQLFKDLMKENKIKSPVKILISGDDFDD